MPWGFKKKCYGLPKLLRSLTSFFWSSCPTSSLHIFCTVPQSNREFIPVTQFRIFGERVCLGPSRLRVGGPDLLDSGKDDSVVCEG